MCWGIYLKLFVFLILIFTINSVNWLEKPQSPCPRMFQYVHGTIETEWFGILSWHYDKSSNLLDYHKVEKKEHLFLTFSLPERPQSNEYLGHIDLVDKNIPLYKINFPIGYYIPKLHEIRVNERIICKGFKRNLLTDPFTYTLEYMEYKNNDKKEVEKLKEDNNLNLMDYNDDDSQETLQELDSNDDNDIFDQFDDLLSLREVSACGIIHNKKRFHVLKSLKKQMSSKYYLQKEKYLCSNHNKSAPNGNILNGYVSKKVVENQKSKGILEGEADAKDVDSYDLNTILFEETLNEMKRGAWPWMAAIYTHNITSLSYQCSGTLITNRFILTVADCILTLNRNEILIFLGRYNLKNWYERGSLAIPTKDIIIHPEYKRNRMKISNANIALIKLTLEVKFNEYIQPACLDYNNKSLQKSNDDLGVVISWMTGSQSIGISRTIPKVIGAIMNAYGNDNQTFCHMNALNYTFCARDILLPGRFHAKDWGAGFLLYIKKRWHLKGILINILDGCSRKSPISNYAFKQWALFIDINKYLEWINFNIEETSNKTYHLLEY